MGALWLLIGAEPALRRVRAFVAAAGWSTTCRTSTATARRTAGPAPSGGACGTSRTLAQGAWRCGAVGEPAKQLLERVAFLLPETSIEALPRPFVVVATDSATGDEVRLTRGSLRLAVAASSAMPGLAPPIALGWPARSRTAARSRRSRCARLATSGGRSSRSR